jgi:hypothetical protein
MFPPIGPTRVERDQSIDFFRGLALLTIYIDHIHPNFLASFTLKSFAFLDASDVFVFISGYVIGLVYTKALWRGGLDACIAKAVRRCVQIYRWHLAITACTFFIMYCFASNGLYVRDHDLYSFLRDPYWTCLSAIALLHTPGYLNILPLYLFLTALTPIMVFFVDRGSRIFLACSAGVYLAVQLVPGLTFRSYPGAVLGTFVVFNPVAWQFLFVLGILAGNLKLHGHSWSVLSKSWAIRLAAVLVLCIAWLRLAPTHGVAALLHTNFWRFHLPTVFPLAGKATLGPLRLLNLLILLVLASQVRRHDILTNNRLSRAVIRCGRNSLEVFGVGVLLSYISGMILAQHPANMLIAVAANMIGCAALIATASIAAKLKKRRSASHTASTILNAFAGGAPASASTT